MLSAHYFYILSCSVYASRGLINYNLLWRQEGEKTHSTWRYVYSIFEHWQGGELTFLSMSKAGCLMFLCKLSGKAEASTFVTLISLLLCSELDTSLEEKVEPLLPAAWSLQAPHAGWWFVMLPVHNGALCWAPATGHGQWDKPLVLPQRYMVLVAGGKNRLSSLSASRKQLKFPDAMYVSTCDTFYVYKVTCLWWQKHRNSS